MSLEFLLLLAIFLLLPLFERILRAAREREQGGPEPAQRPPPAERPPGPVWPPAPLPAPRADIPAGRPLPAKPSAATSVAELRRARARALAAAREAARDAARDAARTAARHPLRRDLLRDHPVAASLRTPGALRRAIVLMTILGPCRGAETQDPSSAPSRAGR